MAEYMLSMIDAFEDDVHTVTSEFETESLDLIAEKVYWFIKSVGFDYVTAVTFEKNDGETVDFSCE